MKAFIGIEKNCSIEYIMCIDGRTFEGFAFDLLLSYDNPFLVEDLIKDGDFVNGQALYIDEGKGIASSREELVENLQYEEYVFLFSSFGWSVFIVADGRWYNLSEYLEEDLFDDDDEIFDNLDTLH